MKKYIIVFGFIIVVIIIWSVISEDKQQSQPANTTPTAKSEQQPRPANTTPTANTNQNNIPSSDDVYKKEVESFLTEIGILTIESIKGSDGLGMAGVALQNDGLPLPYIVSAQLIFESVLEEAKKIKVPSGGNNVKKYFIESVQYQLSGVKTIREGLEVYPMNEEKLSQGLGTFNKGMLSIARSTEEINKLKVNAGL